MAAVLLWWTLVVHGAYGGRWNGLYCNGSAAKFPAWLEGREPLYRVPSPAGYDGQWYHLLAHRPLEYRESAAFMDWPRFRCQRILFPLLVWLVAGGRFEWVDPVYFSMMLAALGAGIYFAAQLAGQRGRTALWGLVFLLMPAAIGSIERMLLDGVLLAAALGMWFFLETGRLRAAWALGVLAPFLRETGLLLSAGACAVWLQQRRWQRLVFWAATPAPFLFWMWWTLDLPGSSSQWLGLFANFQRALERAAPYPYPFPWADMLALLDLAAFTAFLAAAAWGLFELRRIFARRENGQPLLAFVAAIFSATALLSASLHPGDVWDEAYAYARVFSPLLMALFFEALSRRREVLYLLLLAPITLRVGLHPAAATVRSLRHLCGL